MTISFLFQGKFVVSNTTLVLRLQWKDKNGENQDWTSHRFHANDVSINDRPRRTRKRHHWAPLF